MTIKNVAFFGCWSPTQLGHYLYDPSGMSLRSFGPFLPESLDGVFIRRGHHIPGRTHLTFFKGYVVLAFEDQTADRRPGSNGAFLFEVDERSAATSRQTFWKEAERVFPTIAARLRGHIRTEDH